MSHLLVGCSFTDPLWQKEIPWSIEYSQVYKSYIVAKVGMGIKGICTEALYYIKELPDISKVIIILPTLWRMDIEVDEETYLCNAMVDLLFDKSIIKSAHRKWITSGGLNYDKDTEQGKIFSALYKHQGFLVLLKEHVRALKMLIDYCKSNNIEYYISSIKDPLDQFDGLNYIRDELTQLLDEVEYKLWFRFENKFIDKFLKHSRHPSTQEHKIICKYILSETSKEKN